MSAAAPWSVKGIDPKAREIAKDLARRSGMTLGDWLNSMIMDDEDDGVTPLPRRPHASDIFERRGRSRRLDDAYDAEPEPEPRRHDRIAYDRDDTLQRVAAAVDAIAVRIEAAEHRSTTAIESVDQAVSGLLRRMDGQDAVGGQQQRRIDTLAEELRAGHTRLTRFEKDGGEHVASSFARMETAVGALANRLYGIEEFQRASVADLRDRIAVVQETAAAGPGSDALADVGTRLDAAQAQTSDALRGLERSFAELDRRLRDAESRAVMDGGEDSRFEALAETLSRQVEAGRAELLERLEAPQLDDRTAQVEQTLSALTDQLKSTEQRSAQAVEAMGQEVLRIARNLNNRMSRTEAQVETADHDGRLSRLEQAGEQIGQTLSDKIDRDMGRYARAIEQRMVRSDDQHALALEKLGSEIARISDRLADRIAQSERRSAQAIEDIGERLARSSEKVEQRHDRASGELSERMRLSEERTARLLAEARESMEQRAQAVPVVTPARVVAEPHTATLSEPSSDWRSAAFPDDDFGAGDAGWARDPMASDIEPSPFPSMSFAETALFEPESEQAEVSGHPTEAPIITPDLSALSHATPEPATSPGPFSGFGGADVSEALKATAQPAPEAEPTPALLDDDQSYDEAAETEFVDPRALRAAAAAGRAANTRDTVGAARAAMAAPSDAVPERKTFGLNLKRGGKSKLQERLDKQASRDGSTIKKSIQASAVAALCVGGLYATMRLTGVDGFSLSTDEAPAKAEAEVMAAMALTPSGATPTTPSAEATALYDEALEKLDANDVTGVEALTQAANLGQTQAQLKLAGLYQTGASGVERDASQSRLWARRAAEGGDPRGMHAYGMYLFDGVGGERNRPVALTWLVRAADNGLIDSQYNAARIYENGDEGVAPNATEAYKWYLIASRGGDQQALAAVERMSPELPISARTTARTAADAFQTRQPA